MDVSEILAAQAAKQSLVAVQKDIPLELDVGLLVVTDLNAVDDETYEAELENYLQRTTRDGVQSLISSLFSLPSQPSPNGPLALLPPPTTLLPRAKPLPKPKPPTKWDRFASAKGIQKTRRDMKVWDDDRQDWVQRWGKGGKNKQLEEQWITEVPANAAVDHDPVKVAREARKARAAKGKLQQLQNALRAQNPSKDRKNDTVELDKTLAHTRVSTASMGKFDKKLEGDKKLRGVKRKFDPTVKSVEEETKVGLALLSSLESDPVPKKAKRETQLSAANQRKALRYARRHPDEVEGTEDAASALIKRRPRSQPKARGRQASGRPVGRGGRVSSRGRGGSASRGGRGRGRK